MVSTQWALGENPPAGRPTGREHPNLPSGVGSVWAVCLQAELHTESPGHHLRSLRPLPRLPAATGAAPGQPDALRGGASGSLLPTAPGV